jgi:hypothetical protein
VVRAVKAHPCVIRRLPVRAQVYWYVTQAFATSRFLTGNPPFDGNLGGTTIRSLLDLCQLATLGNTHAFRALLLLPLSHAELLKRKLEGATVLMSIPNDTVKFTPAGYLFATAPRLLKTYKEANTTLVYLMYQNDLAVQMRPINRGSLNRHLAAWYMSERDGTEETIIRDIAATTLDLTCFRLGEPSLYRILKNRARNRSFKGTVSNRPTQKYRTRSKWLLAAWSLALA